MQHKCQQTLGIGSEMQRDDGEVNNAKIVRTINLQAMIYDAILVSREHGARPGRILSKI